MFTLFCISYAGGNAKYFFDLKKELSCHSIRVLPIEYAGHGMRSNEEAYHSFNDMSEDVFDIIKENYVENSIIFGYSMGALVAYDIINRLFTEKMRNELFHFFVAAHEPPNIPFRGSMYAHCDKEELLSGMINMGGISNQLLSNKRFLNIYLKRIKADYNLINDYKWDGIYKKLPCGITAFYSENDTPASNMVQWERFTSKDIDMYDMSGGHFFLDQNLMKISEIIKNTIGNIQ